MNAIIRRVFPRKIPDSVRRLLYTVAGPLITVLAAGGLIPGVQAAAWTSLVLAAITLAIAVINCETGWRNAVYAFTCALQVVLQGYGIGTNTTWATISGLVVALLGIGLAAAFTPSGLQGDPPPAVVPVPASGPLPPPAARPAIHAV